MADDDRFAQLVALACHDVRTPLATVYGFARTLGQAELEAPHARYVEMIEAASAQIGELLDELALVARIQSGRYQPALAEHDSLELARAAAAELGADRLSVEGEGAPVSVDGQATSHALARLARAAARHGGHDAVSLSVRGPVLELAPLTRASAPVLLGDELRELGAAAASALIRALGGSVEDEGERLVVRLPTA